MQELFNLRHSKLRNVIERIFGVAKKRFPVLVTMPAFPFAVQVQLVHATCILHNFIRRHQLCPDPAEEEEEEQEGREQEEEPEGGMRGRPAEERGELAEWRDAIAREMWDAYVQGGRA